MSLTIQSLTKAFGEKKLFENLTYDFLDTGIYAVVGESGAGKTTLLRMICGLDNDYSGKIIGGGFENTSFAFQESRLFPELTAIENVVLANHDDLTPDAVTEAEKMLISLGIQKSDQALYPDELSGGMKARISLARAFLNGTPILLLDEPTSELDKENADLVRELILTEAKKRLIIMVSHNPEEIEALGATTIKI